MIEAEKRIREALSAGPTPGPWHHCQPFQSVRAERTLHGTVPAQRVDFVSTKTQPVHERIIIPMAGKEAHVRSEDMAFIAACSPENIVSLLADRDEREAKMLAEIDRLYTTLQYESDCVEAANAEIARRTRQRDTLEKVFLDLHASVVGECPALLNEDRGGSALLIELVAEALTQIEQERDND